MESRLDEGVRSDKEIDSPKERPSRDPADDGPDSPKAAAAEDEATLQTDPRSSPKSWYRLTFSIPARVPSKAHRPQRRKTHKVFKRTPRALTALPDVVSRANQNTNAERSRDAASDKSRSPFDIITRSSEYASPGYTVLSEPSPLSLEQDPSPRLSGTPLKESTVVLQTPPASASPRKEFQAQYRKRPVSLLELRERPSFKSYENIKLLTTRNMEEIPYRARKIVRTGP